MSVKTWAGTSFLSIESFEHKYSTYFSLYSFLEGEIPGNLSDKCFTMSRLVKLEISSTYLVEVEFEDDMFPA